MKIAVLTIRDGRDEVHERSMASLTEMVPEPDTHIVVDDHNHSLGFAGAIRMGWKLVRQAQPDYVFHHEADFIFNQPVPLERMIDVLERHPHLVQMALKRQPVNEDEIAAGGVIEQDPDKFEQVVERAGPLERPEVWVEHRKFWTTNPSIYPAVIADLDWPNRKHSEGRFTLQLCEDPPIRFGMWGWKYDPPMVEHIGERVGVGY